MCKGETSGWPFTYFNDRASNFFLKFDVRGLSKRRFDKPGRGGSPGFFAQMAYECWFPGGDCPAKPWSQRFVLPMGGISQRNGGGRL